MNPKDRQKEDGGGEKISFKPEGRTGQKATIKQEQKTERRSQSAEDKRKQSKESEASESKEEDKGAPKTTNLESTGDEIEKAEAEEETEQLETFPSITLRAINVHSFNVSDYKRGKKEKTRRKIEEITARINDRKIDIILMSECWLGEDPGIRQDIENDFSEKKYELHTNSTQSKRGVAIAIREKVVEKILGFIRDEDENYLLMICRIQKKVMLIGAVYAPTYNYLPGKQKRFYGDLRNKVKDFQIPIILGGDFNTVLDIDLDRKNRNYYNQASGKALRTWLKEGQFCDPYIEKYPDLKDRAMSYFSFKRNRSLEGISRLDFFIISKALLNNVIDVFYDELEDISDHKAVVLVLAGLE